MELAERSKGSEKEVHAKKQQEASQQLQAAKTQLEKLNTERSRIEKLIEKSTVTGASQSQAEDPAAAPASDKKKADKPTRKGGKSKK